MTEFKRGFVNAAVSRAVRLRECPLRELRLYVPREDLLANGPFDVRLRGIESCSGRAKTGGEARAAIFSPHSILLLSR